MDHSIVNIFDTTVAILDRQELLHTLMNNVSGNEPVFIANHNLHSLYLYHYDYRFRKAYQRACLSFVDGQSLIFLFRIFGYKAGSKHRHTFQDFGYSLLDICQKQSKRVFFLGSTRENCCIASEILHRRFPDLRFMMHHGYFGQDSDELLSSIHSFAPDVLIVGMGMPRQELWIDRYWETLPACLILNAGAFIGTLGEEAKIPPRWLGPLGLEWLYRLAMEPRRLAKRYLIEPWFLMPLLVRETIRRKRSADLEAKVFVEPIKKVGYLSGALRTRCEREGGITGPSTHIRGIVKAFRKLSFDVKTFVGGDFWTSFDKPIQRDFVARSTAKAVVADIARMVFGTFNMIIAFLKMRDRHILYERLTLLQSTGFLLKWLARIPWIVEVNGLAEIEGRSSLGIREHYFAGVSKFIERMTLTSADLVIAVSEDLKQQIIKFVGIDPNRIFVMQNGVDLEIFNPNLYATSGDPHRSKPYPAVIGYVGSLSPWQGLDLLIKAALPILREGRLKIEVVGEGVERTKLEQLCRNLEVSDHVIFSGSIPHSEIPAKISEFDLCYSGQIIIPETSNMYHSPLKLYEYMAMGKPVLASNHADARNLIAHAVTGFLFESGDVMSLRNTLVHAVQKRKDWGLLGEAARDFIVSNCSWEKRLGMFLSYLMPDQFNRSAFSNSHQIIAKAE